MDFLSKIKRHNINNKKIKSKMLLEVLESCDDRISKIQKQLLDLSVSSSIMSALEEFYDNDYKLILNNKVKNEKEWLQTCINLVKVEKIIVTALINKTKKKQIYSKLLSKYDEFLNETYDISGNMVNSGDRFEIEHLNYSNESLEQRKFIERLCIYGEKINK